MEINLSSVVPYVSGPKRPQDRVAVGSMKEDFQLCLDQKVDGIPTHTHTHTTISTVQGPSVPGSSSRLGSCKVRAVCNPMMQLPLTERAVNPTLL